MQLEVLSDEVGREVRISNPDKLYFTKQARLSKLDIVQLLSFRCSRGACRHPRSPNCPEALRRWR